ncbi:MAG: glutamine synthetase [Actinomycetales bacterium]|nr:glutamine synthetase [Actinomycetales bacterium]
MLHDLAETRRILETQDIDVVRLIFPDILGITRSKDLLVSQIERAAAHGPAFCQGTWVTTTRGGVLDAGAGTGSIEDGLPDMVSKLDTDTIRPIPWLPGVAYAIADIDNPDGSRSTIAPRAVLRSVLDEYDKEGLIPVCGPELEFYIAQRTDDGWARCIDKTGRVYMTGALVDPAGHYLHLLRMLDQLNVGAFAGNHEFSPSQYEINLWHSEAMDAADRTFLFKTAVKDVLAERGVLGTFLGKPWNDEGGSGFHLHFSVTDPSGMNKMHDGGAGLSEVALQMIAGVIEHAPAIAAFTNPTVNAYKRLGPDTLAPYRSNWGYDNRSTMLRIPPERGQGTRLELRIGDGTANPYIVLAVVLAAALDGVRRGLTPPPAAEGWAYEDESSPVLPMTLREALDALEADGGLRHLLPSDFIDVFVTMKRDEADRYDAEVEDPSTRDTTRWELEEYIEDL